MLCIVMLIFAFSDITEGTRVICGFFRRRGLVQYIKEK